LSEDNTKELTIDLEEQLPQIEISRSGNNMELIVPSDMSNRVIKLRIKKFLHRKNLKEKYRPISYNSSDIKGYRIKEKRTLELTYY